MNQQLYNDLKDLRERLKKKYLNEEGRTPVICSDASLYELARLAPKNKKEMEFIAGLGSTFIDKYGDDFLVILSYHYNIKINQNSLPNNYKTILKNLEGRLVNINKRNRLLYLNRLYNKYAIDLFNDEKSNEDLTKLLLNRLKKNFELVNLNKDNKRSSEIKYKKYLSLLREINKDYKESGQYDLYIGYPFVVGKMMGEDFYVRAPLLLFPVVIDQQIGKISLKLDTEKDILFNNNLILAHNKFNNINRNLPDNTFQKEDKVDLFKEAISFYQENGIAIKGNIDVLQNFTEYLPDDYQNFISGEFIIENIAILGKFSIYSSALQKDFKDILDSEEINVRIVELLSEESLNEVPAEFKYSKHQYIHHANYYQEEILSKAEANDTLVIQGPPGTGKSQTIVNLISDAVLKGKNILMVSQKKAAIDVIHSRLGYLNKFALLLDDVKNKESFYKQLNAIMQPNNPLPNNELNDNMDEIIEIFDKERKTWFIENEYKYPYRKLFLESMDAKKIRILYKPYFVFLDILTNYEYSTVKEMVEHYKDEKIFNETLNSFLFMQKNSWLDLLKPNYRSMPYKEDILNIINSQQKYLKRNRFIKVLLKLFQKRKFKKYSLKYFTSPLSYFYEPELLFPLLNEEEKMIASKKCLASLDKLNKTYMELCCQLNRDDQINYTINDANLNEKCFIYYKRYLIDKFISRNQEMILYTHDYEQKFNYFKQYIEKKQDNAHNNLYNYLSKNIEDFILTSKRVKEMQRLLEGKRRWSIKRYIDKFSFELFKGVKIWLMTPESVSEIIPLTSGFFDLVIFDEASQIYIEKAIPAIHRARKVIIAGDKKQLRPSSLGMGRMEYDDETDDEMIESSAALEEDSLLDLARFKYPEAMLNYHYRSKYEELIAFSDAAFYQGQLIVAPNTNNNHEPPIKVIRVNNGVWIDRTNRIEAVRTISLLKELLISKEEKKTIGVITFNSSQRDLILDLIDEECQKDSNFASLYEKESKRVESGQDIGLFIKNIENVQGDERDYIIFSIAYAKTPTGRVTRNYGWLNTEGGENRLNVGITRAKQQIYIITSIYSEELFVDDLKNEGPKLFKQYLSYAYAISNKDYEKVNEILNSLHKQDNLNNINKNSFVNLVNDELINKGYKTIKKVGIGEELIDLAIVDDSGNFLLGLDCNEHHELSSRELDFHRKEFLEGKGWIIHRVSLINWWVNKEEELNKILEHL